MGGLSMDGSDAASAGAAAAAEAIRDAQECTVATDHDRSVVDRAVGRGRLLFIGASYSIGLGATRPADHFTAELADSLGLPFRVDAVSGTGFVNAGPRHQGTFLERMAADPTSPAPRLVVIQGGRDDAGIATATQEYDAALATIRYAQQRFSQAQVLVLGPIPALLPVSRSVLAVDRVVGAAAAAAHAGYIDAIAEHWITPANDHQYVGLVPGHPNNEGYAYIAQRLLTELPTALHQAQAPLVRPDDDDDPDDPDTAAATPAPDPKLGLPLCPA